MEGRCLNDDTDAKHTYGYVVQTRGFRIEDNSYKNKHKPNTMVYFLESLSARYPVHRTPNQAPSSRMETSQPFVEESETAVPILCLNWYMLQSISSAVEVQETDEYLLEDAGKDTLEEGIQDILIKNYFYKDEPDCNLDRCMEMSESKWYLKSTGHTP